MSAVFSDSLGASFVSQPKAYNIDLLCEEISRQGFAHISGLFSQELLKSLHSEIEQLDNKRALQTAGVGRGGDYTIQKTIRSDKIKWIDGETLAQIQLQEKLEQLRFEINQRLMLGLFDVESMFAVYREGDLYKRHLDSFAGAKNRLLSMVIYLNPEWQHSDGGLLKLYKDESTTTPFAELVPVWGDVVIFLSEKIPHEVTPAKQTRYSIASWFRCNNLNPLT